MTSVAMIEAGLGQATVGPGNPGRASTGLAKMGLANAGLANAGLANAGETNADSQCTSLSLDGSTAGLVSSGSSVSQLSGAAGAGDDASVAGEANGNFAARWQALLEVEMKANSSNPNAQTEGSPQSVRSNLSSRLSEHSAQTATVRATPSALSQTASNQTALAQAISNHPLAQDRVNSPLNLSEGAQGNPSHTRHFATNLSAGNQTTDQNQDPLAQWVSTPLLQPPLPPISQGPSVIASKTGGNSVAALAESKGSAGKSRASSEGKSKASAVSSGVVAGSVSLTQPTPVLPPEMSLPSGVQTAPLPVLPSQASSRTPAADETQVSRSVAISAAIGQPGSGGASPVLDSRSPDSPSPTFSQIAPSAALPSHDKGPTLELPTASSFPPSQSSSGATSPELAYPSSPHSGLPQIFGEQSKSNLGTVDSAQENGVNPGPTALPSARTPSHSFVAVPTNAAVQSAMQGSVHASQSSPPLPAPFRVPLKGGSQSAMQSVSSAQGKSTQSLSPTFTENSDQTNPEPTNLPPALNATSAKPFAQTQSLSESGKSVAGTSSLREPQPIHPPSDIRTSPQSNAESGNAANQPQIEGAHWQTNNTSAFSDSDSLSSASSISRALDPASATNPASAASQTPSGLNLSVSSAGIGTSTQSAVSVPIAESNPFAALDAPLAASSGVAHSLPLGSSFAAHTIPSQAVGTQPTGGQPSWVRMDTRQVEAGYHDPALGWVEVRAGQGADGIHATLVPSSSGAAESLGQHLTGIESYLAEHHTPIESLTISTTASATNANGGVGSGATGDSGGQQRETGAGSSGAEAGQSQTLIGSAMQGQSSGGGDRSGNGSSSAENQSPLNDQMSVTPLSISTTAVRVDGTLAPLAGSSFNPRALGSIESGQHISLMA